MADAVAELLALPFDHIFLEIVFRGLYRFHQAYVKGKGTDPVLFFTALKNQNLDVVKMLRNKPQLLDLSSYPLPLTEARFS